MVTIKDVAARTGVSVATVSSVLNGKSSVRRIPAATRERVQRAARELGYRPNSIARSLFTGKTHTLGFVITNLTNPLFAEITEALHHVARERGYDLLVALDERSVERESQQVERLLERRVDGILLWGGYERGDADCLERLRQHGVPYVALGTRRDDPHTSFIDVDRPAGVELAVDHLVRLGRTRLAYIGSDVGAATPSAYTKYEGLLAALRRRSMEPGACVRCHIPATPGVDGRIIGYETGRALSLDIRAPDAYLCMGDTVAIGLMAALRARGVAVPSDIAVIGFDGIPEGAFANPALTTIAQPVTEIVEHGLTTLLRLVEDPDATPFRLHLQPRLVVRESCGATPQPAIG